MHHTGSQEEVPVVVPEEQARVDPQEIQKQEVPEAEEPGEELPECVDHQPSSFERGKPWSIQVSYFIKQLTIYKLYVYYCIKF
jgi:hypothetical protein